MINGNRRTLEKAMAAAATYSDWSEAAKAYDVQTGANKWIEADESKYFDYTSIRRRLERLEELAENGDNPGLLFALNEGIHGNMDGMGHYRLYERARFGTKDLIQQYIDAIADSLNHLADPKVTDIPFEDKLDLFRRAQHCYGRSAFLMSGSGSFLYFHLGVAMALWKEGLLPKIISGSSGGSVVGAILCTHEDDDLERFFDPAVLTGLSASGGDPEVGAFGMPKRLSADQIREQLSEIIPDLTFQEAYELTGRDLNISIAPAERHQTSRLLNAIASPNVFIREAVWASCAVPGIYPSVSLMAKDHKGKRVPYLPDRKWVDGSVTNDLPTKRLSRLYGANHHIVSQANPIVTPFAKVMKPQQGSLAAIRSASISTVKAWANANATLMQKPLSYFPALNSMTSMMLSVMNQTYSGDINIVCPPMLWSPTKMLSELPREDIQHLMDLGERTAWPQIEMVRTQTKVSQTLESILFDYEDELVHEHSYTVKRKIA